MQQIPNSLPWNLGATMSNFASKGSRFLGKAFLQDSLESAYNFSVDREEKYFNQFTYTFERAKRILKDEYDYISREMPQNHQRRLDYLQRKGIDLQRQGNPEEIAKNQGKVERVLSNIEKTKQRTQIMNNMMKNLPPSPRQPYDPGQILNYNFSPTIRSHDPSSDKDRTDGYGYGGKKKRTSKRKIKRKRTSKRRIKRKVY
jgi:hypothetical protein